MDNFVARCPQRKTDAEQHSQQKRPTSDLCHGRGPGSSYDGWTRMNANCATQAEHKPTESRSLHACKAEQKEEPNKETISKHVLEGRLTNTEVPTGEVRKQVSADRAGNRGAFLQNLSRTLADPTLTLLPKEKKGNAPVQRYLRRVTSSSAGHQTNADYHLLCSDKENLFDPSPRPAPPRANACIATP